GRRVDFREATGARDPVERASLQHALGGDAQLEVLFQRGRDEAGERVVTKHVEPFQIRDRFGTALSRPSFSGGGCIAAKRRWRLDERALVIRSHGARRSQRGGDDREYCPLHVGPPSSVLRPPTRLNMDTSKPSA